jgi:hypothetical protein
MTPDNLAKIPKILGELAAEIYKLKRWKGDVGDNPDTDEEKWFDKVMDMLININ